MRKLLIAVVVLAILAGGGFYLYRAGTGAGEAQIKVAIDQAIQQLPPEWEAHYAGLELSPVNRSATLKGLTLHYKPAPGADITVDEITVENPSLSFGDDWNKARANPDQVKPETVLPVADAVTFRKTALTSDGDKATIGELRIEKLRIYPWSLTRPGVPTLAEIKALIEKSSNIQNLDQAMPLLRFEAAGITAFGYDHGSSTDISIKGNLPAQPNVPGGPFSETVAKSVVDGVDRGRIKTAEAEGILVKAPPGEHPIKIGKIEYADLDMRSPATRIAAGEKPDRQMLDQISLGKMSASEMSGSTGTGSPITIAGFGIYDLAFAKGLPVSGRLALDHLHVAKTAADDPDFQQAFDKLGLHAATISFSLGYSWDLDKKHVTVHDTALAVEELGALDLAGDLANISESGLEKYQGALAHAVLHYKDNSLVNRAIKATAADSGADPKAVRTQIIQALQGQQATFPGDAVVADAIGQLVAFVKSPKALTVELAPPTPFDLQSLNLGGAAPHDLGTKLGLKVTNNG